MFSTPDRAERLVEVDLDAPTLPELHDTASDFGPGPETSGSEIEVLAPRLIDLEAYRRERKVLPARLPPQPAGPPLPWALVAGFAAVAFTGGSLIVVAGLVIVALFSVF